MQLTFNPFYPFTIRLLTFIKNNLSKGALVEVRSLLPNKVEFGHPHYYQGKLKRNGQCNSSKATA